MSESILTSVKKMIGITEDDTTFDMDIIIHINSIFMILHQLGIGPSNGFFITDKTPIWSSYVPEIDNIAAVKSYMFLRVKAIFDPSPTSFTQDSFKRTIDEMEWRLIHQKEFGNLPPPPPL